MTILNTILPVFVIIAAGFVLRWRRFFGTDFADGISRLTYWVGLPALLFYKTASSRYSMGDIGVLFAIVMSGMLAAALIAVLAARLLRLKGKQTGIMVQGALRGNLVYIGIPIIMYSLAGQDGAAEAESMIVIVIALTVPVYNICSVIALLAGLHQFDRASIRRMLIGIISNPLLLASLAGISYNLLFDGLHPIAYRTLDAIGQMALPLALISIGATLYQERIGRNFLPTAIAAAAKVFISPLAGLLAAILIGANPLQTRLGLLLLACPTAISSHILAEQIVGRQNLSASIVILSTLLSMLSFTIVLACF